MTTNKSPTGEAYLTSVQSVVDPDGRWGSFHISLCLSLLSSFFFLFFFFLLARL
ncbi:hypothetical protein BDW42DRAFT_166394 [Aspergillus taichungensis]|uniref:Uncharacterized protein n=1 Tax=Aspergillus taichungensis TaxID=482145 RepID=A0A2J5HYZ7_9EURO|nr:hypothetical protein BDW42DRAFT_166394 [Aspergillus taichungensis]